MARNCTSMAASTSDSKGRSAARSTGPRRRRILLAIAIAGSCLFAATSGTSAQTPPAAHEPGEELPGGKATSRSSTNNRNAFSHASGNLSFAKEFDFKIGNALFRKLWVSAPSSTKSSDGLGPLYNARSCQRCHLKDGRGHPPAANWPKDNAVSMFLRLSVPPRSDAQRELLERGRINVVPEPTYGTQLQDLAIQGHAGEGRMHISYKERTVRLAGGEEVRLRVPTYRITDLGYGPLHPQTMISPRVAPQMIGLGLLEAIPEEHIIANADPSDKDGDGISGRPNRVWSLETERLALGRFGWKAGAPTVLQQSAEAFAGDIGISNDLVRRPAGDCTANQDACTGAPNGESSKDPEIKRSLLRLVAFYSRNLAVPRRRDAGAANVLAGKQVFHRIGCASCHVPSFTTGANSPDENLRNQIIWPYTDLLLHDMGPGLADGRPEGRASGREWRTAPLWGIGLTKTVSGHTYLLHDGRARNVVEAILWHGGEAQAARDRFADLPKSDRDRLIAFLKSL
jgi:CxxC motif-containing protein (DUF1111 family)